MTVLDVVLMSEGAVARRCGVPGCHSEVLYAFELTDPPRWGHGLLCRSHANDALLAMPVARIWSFKERIV